MTVENTPRSPNSARRSLWRTAGIVAAVVASLYFVVAYVVMPRWWHVYMGRHPALANIPNITHTGSGIDGDPLNLGLIGSQKAVVAAMLAAKWHPADPLTLKSCLEIAEATVLRRSYEDAPVSNLFLWGRKEDLAFEQPVGDDPRKRHHVRFWKSEKVDAAGNPLWIGAATYDERVGLSHTTGQITHHIAAEVDRERDHVFETLLATGDLRDDERIKGFHTTRTGRNGGGDRWETDGDLRVGTIVIKGQ